MPFPNTILVVDHDPAIRELLIEILNDEGYHTRSAPTGWSALAALSAESPVLTLYDMALPDLGAGELIDELQALGLTGARLVLMSTAPLDASSSLVAGTLGYLGKPFDIDVLLSLVARLVDPPSRLSGMALEADRR